MATGAPGRSISVARVARDSRETMSHDSNIESPAAVAVPIPIPIAGHRGRSVGHAVGRTRGRSAPPRPDLDRARVSVAIPAHENNVRSPRFLLRRPRRRLQGDQGPSTYSVFFRRSTVVVVPRETSREGRRERASAREGDTIAARGGRAMDDAGRCDRRARAVTTNEKALGISYPPIVSSVASSRATTDATTRARATERSRWIAIDRGSIDSGGGIGYFV